MTLIGPVSGEGGFAWLVFEIGYHPRKKNHIIRVVFQPVFQDQAMYVHTLFRGAKMCKIREMGAFLVMFANFGKDIMEKLRKKHAKIFSIFIA